jgi:ATP-dependent DNA helicase DinG
MRGPLIANISTKPARASVARSGRPTARSHPVRVSIDLETTGLQPETDAIIEIAAVKFRGPIVLDTFQTFVSTKRTIPYRVQRLTGLTAADLERAPHFEAVAHKLSAFLGKAALVGHSVPFDAAFLRRQGLALENPLIDTFELATVLLPALPSYTLERVAEALNVQSEVFHRAMADAVLAKDVLLALLERIEQLELPVLEELELLSGHLSWPLLSLFMEERHARARRVSPHGSASIGEQVAAKLGVNPQVFSLGIARPVGMTAGATADSEQKPASPAPSPAAVLPGEALAPESIRVHPAIEATIAEAFATPRPLLLEIEPDAQSLAGSLLVAIRRAQEARRPLVIAAANPGACRRLMQETLPELWASLPQTPNVAFLAEQEKYLCLHRWFGAGRLPRNEQLPTDITRGLAKLTLWLNYSTNGIRDELALMSHEQAAWELVRAGQEYCENLAACPYARSGYCFVSRARAAVAEADIVVMTHAAMLDYLANDDTLLAQTTHLLVLDAHALEEEALRQGTYELQQSVIARLLDDLLVEQPENKYSGLLALATRVLEQTATAGRGALPVEARLASWQEPVRETKQALDRFFSALALLLAEQQNQPQQSGPRGSNEGNDPSLRLTAKLHSVPSWKGVEQAWSELDKGLVMLVLRLERLIALLNRAGTQEGQRAPNARKAGQPGGTHETSRPVAVEPAALAVELQGVSFRLGRLAEQGRLAISQPRSGMVYWVKPPLPPLPPRAAAPLSVTQAVEAAAQPAMPSLHAAPVHAGPLLQRTIFHPDRAAVLVASSLTVAGEFDYTAERLGLATGRAATLSVAPEERPQTLLYLPDDVAEPNTNRYQRHLDAMLVQLATALNGEMLVLFPSHAALRAGYAGIKAKLEERGILVLAQVMDGSVRQIWQTFRSQERVVLLGALNSWDSADLPGERPSCVVVTRLPFPPLSDPPVAGRAELHHDQMHQFIIPQATLRLRQALNRVSWSGSRRNAVVLFDRRVQAKDYGAVFMNSMPRCTVRQGSVSLLPEQVAGWIRGEDNA